MTWHPVTLLILNIFFISLSKAGPAPSCFLQEEPTSASGIILASSLWDALRYLQGSLLPFAYVFHHMSPSYWGMVGQPAENFIPSPVFPVLPLLFFSLKYIYLGFITIKYSTYSYLFILFLFLSHPLFLCTSWGSGVFTCIYYFTVLSTE